jgi:hypothetical protein
MRYLLVFGIIVLTNFSFATTWTLDNRPFSGAQFSTLQSAYDSAMAGDTILIKGSDINYGNLTVEKQIHFIGEGYNALKDVPTLLPQAGFNITPGSGTDPSGTSISGMYLNGINFLYLTLSGSASTPLSGIQISRCHIRSVNLQLYTFNTLISNCIITNGFGYAGHASSNPGGAPSFILLNSIVYAGVQINSAGNIYGSNSRIIRNCIFWSEGSASARDTEGRGMTVENCIFYGVTPFSTGKLFNCTFRNNISFNAFDNAFSIINGNISISNQPSVDPMFETFSPTNFQFDFLWDFRLKTASTGKNAGTDGTDMGIYGGVGYVEGGPPGSGYQTSAMPQIPKVMGIFIQNPIVPQNGSINVNVKGEVQQ